MAKTHRLGPPGRTPRPNRAPKQVRPRGEVERMALRRREAMAARGQGANFRQIAAQCGVSVRTAWKDVNAELQAVVTTTRAEAARQRDLELERADRILRALHKDITGPDAPASIRACSVALRVSDLRCKLLGLYKQVEAPTDPQQRFANLSEREVAFRVEKLVEHAKKHPTHKGP